MLVGKGKRFCQSCQKSMFLDHFIQKVDKNGKVFYRCSLHEKEILDRPITYRCRCHDRKHFTEDHFIKIPRKNGSAGQSVRQDARPNRRASQWIDRQKP